MDLIEMEDQTFLQEHMHGYNLFVLLVLLLAG